MKIILTGGGTGGHVLPAVAIAQKLTEKYKDTQILFIGRLGGDENKEVIRAGLELREIEVYGIQRRLTLKNIRSVLVALRSAKEARRIIKEFAPDIVVGTGGYVCWPVLRAAQGMKIPTMIHESNVCPGLVTRLLSPRCNATLLNHKQTVGYLRQGCVTHTVGNPLRKAFYTASRAEARRRLSLLRDDVLVVSFGGSGGAQKMNECITELMKEYSSSNRKIKHIHATGRKYYEKYRGIVQTSRRCKTVPYIDDMPTYLKAADVVICRAGAMTLSEISAAGCPAILIPSPNVTDNHQYKNASLLSSAGAAILIEERELTVELLKSKVDMLAQHPDMRKDMSKCIEKFANSNSADTIADLIKEAAK